MTDSQSAAPQVEPGALAVGGQSKEPADLHLRAKVPLRMQAEAANCELTMRYRVYSQRVKAGKMTEAEKAAGISEMRAIRDTLRLFAEYEDEVRATLQRCLERRAIEDEVAALQESNPEAAAAIGHVTTAFPGTSVRVTPPLTTHHSPLTPALSETP